VWTHCNGRFLLREAVLADAAGGKNERQEIDVDSRAAANYARNGRFEPRAASLLSLKVSTNVASPQLSRAQHARLGLHTRSCRLDSAAPQNLKCDPLSLHRAA